MLVVWVIRVLFLSVDGVDELGLVILLVCRGCGCPCVGSVGCFMVVWMFGGVEVLGFSRCVMVLR